MIPGKTDLTTERIERGWRVTLPLKSDAILYFAERMDNTMETSLRLVELSKGKHSYDLSHANYRKSGDRWVRAVTLRPEDIQHSKKPVRLEENYWPKTLESQAFELLTSQG